MHKYTPILHGLTKMFHVKHFLEIGSDINLDKDIFENNLYPDLFTFNTVIENKIDIDQLLKLSKKYPRINVMDKPPAYLYNYDFIFINDIKNHSRKNKILDYVTRELLPGVIIISEIDKNGYKSYINKGYNNYFLVIDNHKLGVYSREVLPKTALKRLNFVLKKYQDTEKRKNIHAYM